MKNKDLLYILIPACLFLFSQTVAHLYAGNSTQIAVEDQAGQTVHLPQEIDRVVTAMYPIATQFVCILKARDKLVGISKYSAHSVMKRIYPELTEIPQPGSTPHSQVAIEEILKLHPDLVFTHRGNRMDKLKSLSIPTFCLTVESPEALIKGIRILGTILDRKSRAEEVATYYRKKLAWIEEKTSPIASKKRVYFAGPDMLSTSGGDRYQHFLIEAAGGINVAEQNRGGWSGITIEQLIAWDPQVIIVAEYGSARPKSFLNDSRLKGIKAIKTGQVFKIPSFIFSWDVPTPESLLGIMWLANKMYPSRVSFDLKKEIRSFYSTMYDYTPSQSEIISILDKE